MATPLSHMSACLHSMSSGDSREQIKVRPGAGTPLDRRRALGSSPPSNPGYHSPSPGSQMLMIMGHSPQSSKLLSRSLILKDPRAKCCHELARATRARPCSLMPDHLSS